LNGVDLDIDRRECVVLTGRNGSGKTVLARHLNGLLLPSAGSVTVAGRDVAADPGRARRLVGLVFQDVDSQIIGETVEADLAFGPRNLGLQREEIDRRVEKALDAMDLRRLAGRPCHLLSGGEKRRLALAGVLVMEPRVIIFDEPFSSLDHPGVLEVSKQLDRLSEEGRTVLIITHDLDAVIGRADRLVVMEHGRVVEDGEPSAVAQSLESHGVRKPGGAVL
jgi:biotin transport system ATP-binding protein